MTDEATDDATENGTEADADPESEERPPSDSLATAQADVAKYRDLALRATADFDNYRKRARREIEDARKAGREELLKEFLPVFDNLERAITSAARVTDVKALTEGLLMILKQFENTLAKSGINKIATVGSSFDPAVHEAIQQIETNEHAPGTIVAEVQPGYHTTERLIRAAMVVVAKPKAGSDPPSGDGSNQPD